MRVGGLGGGIACGKSEVTRMLLAHGIPVIDCDRLHHKGMQRGRWAYKRVVAAFGSTILTADGEVDRQRLGEIIFNNAAARRRLNAATHLPLAFNLLWRLLLHWLTFTPVVVVDMPLLFETGSHRLTWISVAVWCDEEQQLQRLINRDGLTRDSASARISAQMPISRKRAMADVDIDNSNSIQALQRQVDALVTRLKCRARWWGLATSPAGLAAGIAAVVWCLKHGAKLRALT